MARGRIEDDSSTDEQQSKRQALAADRTPIQDASSVRQQAEKYRLPTAKMPLNPLILFEGLQS
jgi:hypothetical protein